MRFDVKKWYEEAERERLEHQDGFGAITWLAGLLAVGGLFLLWYLEQA